ncbi:MAG: DUF3127 domain-containing protein [Prevotellaceae bacterium]|jgi:hypothetical protein|nr:DUF3127 domain-containing protein [Prevotellaceae bacterium]
MALELTGKILQKLSVQSGQSAKGAWSKQEFILETLENYPRKVCMSVWGADKVSELATFAEGQTVKVSFNLESRPYNERWFTDARAWRFERSGTHEIDSASTPIVPPPISYSDPSYLDTGGVTDMDDLPF